MQLPFLHYGCIAVMKSGRLRSLKGGSLILFSRTRHADVIGDIKGGVTAALTALPVELVYGLFAVAPLSAAYAEHGMRAALWGCVLGGFLCCLFRSTGGMLIGTRPATALILGSLATSLLYQPQVLAAPDPEALVFVLLLACTALAGFFQFLFGVARVGRVIKYIPFPVTAGLMLGVAVLMLLGSLRPALGASNQTDWQSLLEVWHPASLGVTTITLAFCFLAPRWKSPVPGTILAFIFGTLTHQALALLLGRDQLGDTSVSISGLIPDYMFLGAGAELFGGWPWWEWLSLLISYALTIAAFGALETLLCLSTIGNSLGYRPNGDRELRVQGYANLIAGALGATTSVGNLSRVAINLSAGGSTRFSGVVYVIALGSIVVLAGNVVSYVPYAVTAAIVIYYAVQMVDDGTRRITQQILIRNHLIGRQYYRVLLANFTVIVMVASVAVIGDMMKAVGVGVAAAMFLFIRNSMKPPIRRVSHAGQRKSMKIWSAADVELLKQEGKEIAIIEVDGPLFFGTADSIAEEIDRVAKSSRLLILDLSHVSDIDPTGARTLMQASRSLVKRQKTLLISGVNPLFERFFDVMGLNSIVPPGHWYRDLDQALEAAENNLLTQLGGHSGHAQLSLGQTALADGLQPDDVSLLEGFLVRKEYSAPAILFYKDEAGDSLYVAGSSSVDIMVPLENGEQKRIVSLAPGLIFGEMALLEGKARSTTAVLIEPSQVWELSRSAFDALLLNHPRLARQVLFNVGRQLSARLRSVTFELTQREAEERASSG